MPIRTLLSYAAAKLAEEVNTPHLREQIADQLVEAVLRSGRLGQSSRFLPADPIPVEVDYQGPSPDPADPYAFGWNGQRHENPPSVALLIKSLWPQGRIHLDDAVSRLASTPEGVESAKCKAKKFFLRLQIPRKIKLKNEYVELSKAKVR